MKNNEETEKTELTEEELTAWKNVAIIAKDCIDADGYSINIKRFIASVSDEFFIKTKLLQ